MARLQLFYPSKPFRVNQQFGDSVACVEDKPALPITKRKVVEKVAGTCPAGYVPLYPLLGMKGHTGVDLFAIRGTPIYASQAGTVEEVSTEIERGLGIGIITDERYDFGEHGRHFAKYRNWHLLSIAVKLGQHVEAGDFLGLADSTGLSAGDHNHFELKPVEKDTAGNWYNVFQNNGYFGATDPLPFFNGVHAQDAKLLVGLYRETVRLLTLLLAAKRSA